MTCMHPQGKIHGQERAVLVPDLHCNTTAIPDEVQPISKERQEEAPNKKKPACASACTVMDLATLALLAQVSARETRTHPVKLLTYPVHIHIGSTLVRRVS